MITTTRSPSHFWQCATKRTAIRSTVRRMLAVTALLLWTARVATAATFTEAGAQLNLDLNTAGESVVIVSNGASYTLTVAGSSWSGTDSANVAGNGTATLTVTAAGLAAFDTITFTDSATGTAATFIDSGANTYGDTFNLTLDDATAGTITFAGASSFTGSASITARTSRNLVFASGSSLDTLNGNILLVANQQAVVTSGNFIGILFDAATVEATGTGAVTVQGRGGNSGGAQYGVGVQSGAVLSGGPSGSLIVTGTGGATSGNDNYGVYLQDANSRITSGGGNVSVTGQGGGTGTSSTNIGVVAIAAGQISASGTGTVTVTGTGGATSGGINNGVYLQDANSRITSGGGNVSVIGQGGGAGASGNNAGVYVITAGQINAGGTGTVTVVGTGGATSGSSNHGVFMAGPNTQIASGGGNVSVTGTGTAVGEAIYLQSSAAITTATTPAPILLTADSLNISASSITAGTDLVTIQPRTAGTLIDLGGADVLSGSPLTLGLTDAELDQVTAGTLEIGNISSGSLTVSTNITRPATTAVELISGSDVVLSGGQVNTAGGTLLLDPGVTPAAVKPTRTATDATASTVSFGSDLNINIVGTTVDTQYTQLNVVGAVNLANADLVLSGGYVAQLGDVFTIVSATSVTGTFTGLPDGSTVGFFNGRTLEVNYTATTVTLLVSAVPVELQSFEVE